jgi:hypothetical protein
MSIQVVIWQTHALWLVGPFKTMDEAGAWGSKWQESSGDDPRWHTIELGQHANQTEFNIGMCSPDRGMSMLGHSEESSR